MKSIDIKRADRFVAREMIRAVFYLEQSHIKSSDKVFQALQAFVAFVPAATPLLLNHPGGDWDRFESGAEVLAAARRRLLSEPREPNCSLIVCSDDKNISDFSFEYNGFNLDEPDFSSWASVVKVTLPPEDLTHRRVEAQALIMSALMLLPAFMAYACPSLEGEQAVIQQLAKRHLGLDISSVSSVAKGLGRRAAGVFWLTAFKGALALAVRPTFSRPDRPGQIQVAEVNGETTVVLLSPEPSRLTLRADEGIASYRWLAQALNGLDLHYDSGRIVYFEDEEGTDDVDAQAAWHRRFLPQR